jgi:hypothetical protein
VITKFKGIKRGPCVFCSAIKPLKYIPRKVTSSASQNSSQLPAPEDAATASGLGGTGELPRVALGAAMA